MRQIPEMKKVKKNALSSSKNMTQPKSAHWNSTSD